MLYTLTYWDLLITCELHPLTVQHPDGSRKRLQEIVRQSALERDRLRQGLAQEFLAGENPAVTSFRVQFCQTVLTRLLDRLYFYREELAADKNVLELYEEISKHLQVILDFIKECFDSYFDRHAIMPAIYMHQQRCALYHLLNELDTSFQLLTTLAPQLVKILRHHFELFKTSCELRVSYQGLDYHRNLLAQLVPEVSSQANELSKVEAKLIQLNFNEPLFIEYLFSIIESEVKQQRSAAGKLDLLRSRLRRTELIEVNRDDCLYCDSPSIKDRLVHFLEGEISFLQTTMPLMKAGSFTDRDACLVQVPFKGPEIYLLQKSFIDAGGAPAENYKSLLQKIARQLANKNQRGFSVESLQKNSDKVSYDAREHVKRFLQKMIRNIDSY